MVSVLHVESSTSLVLCSWDVGLVGQRTARGKHCAVCLNGGVDCLVVKIALGGRSWLCSILSTWKERRLYRETLVFMLLNLGQSSVIFCYPFTSDTKAKKIPLNHCPNLPLPINITFPSSSKILTKNVSESCTKRTSTCHEM